MDRLSFGTQKSDLPDSRDTGKIPGRRLYLLAASENELENADQNGERPTSHVKILE